MKAIDDFKNKYEKLEITDDNVYAACSFLDQEDIKPTYDNLRLLFGRGSNSVLTPGKRKWETDKVGKADLNAVNPPEKIMTLLLNSGKALWREALTESNKTAEINQKAYDAHIKSLTTSLEEVNKTHDKLIEKLQEAKKELVELTKTNMQLHKVISEKDEEIKIKSNKINQLNDEYRESLEATLTKVTNFVEEQNSNANKKS